MPCSLLRVLTRRGTEDATSTLIDRFFQQQQFGPGEDPQPINYPRRGADRRIQPNVAGCRWIIKPGEPAEGPEGSGARDRSPAFCFSAAYFSNDSSTLPLLTASLP